MLLSLFNKYVNTNSNKKVEKEEKKSSKDKHPMVITTSVDEGGCCSSAAPSCLGCVDADDNRHPPAPAPTTLRTCRSEFARSSTAALFPNSEFTNHESLPRLSDAFAGFSDAYPRYNDTGKADEIRQQHYSHLAHHVCLDYAGFTLFSHSQLHSSPAPHFFSVSHSNAGGDGGELESAIKSRVMGFLNLSEEDYTMVCAANRTSAFKLLAEDYPFGQSSSKTLLTVYDHDDEAVSAMADAARKRGAKVVSSTFTWPSLRIHSANLKRVLRHKSKKKGGLFVFPLQSGVTGAKYPYLWMKIAEESGWRVALDACALGQKDLDTLGLSLIQPHFIICSFFKVLGEVPSGFACVLVKNVNPSPSQACAAGTVSIVPLRRLNDDADTNSSSSFSGPISGTLHSNTYNNIVSSTPEIVEVEEDVRRTECRGLDHADSLGLLLISSRLRYITNWLVIALLKLRHPNSENGGHSLVRIYGPRVKFERGPAVAFNVVDWRGEKVEPALVQKLADRSNISLACGFLRNIWFSDKHQDAMAEATLAAATTTTATAARRRDEGGVDVGISVVYASLGFLTNFEDAYKLWSFVARFLDADFVEKERWRYMTLNQKMIEV